MSVNAEHGLGACPLRPGEAGTLPPPLRGIPRALELVSAWYDRGAAVVSSLIMLALVGVISTQVFWRYVLNAPLPWPEEVAGFLFAWLVFWGPP